MKRVELRIFVDVDTTGSIDENKFCNAIDECITNNFGLVCNVARVDYIDEIEI